MKTTSLQRRIAKLSANEPHIANDPHIADEPPIVQVWFEGDDGMMRNNRDDTLMTREAFEALPDVLKLKIFDKKLVRRHQCGGENANCSTEKPGKGVAKS